MKYNESELLENPHIGKFLLRDDFHMDTAGTVLISGYSWQGPVKSMVGMDKKKLYFSKTGLDIEKNTRHYLPCVLLYNTTGI